MVQLPLKLVGRQCLQPFTLERIKQLNRILAREEET